MLCSDWLVGLPLLIIEAFPIFNAVSYFSGYWLCKCSIDPEYPKPWKGYFIFDLFCTAAPTRHLLLMVFL
jgi:hypothetical protein